MTAAAHTSTMAVYTHFGGMQELITAVATEGLREFAVALKVAQTDDPVADLLRCGAAYRRFAIERPHLYRLMFGSTSVHGINAPTHNVLDFTIADVARAEPSFANLVDQVHRCMAAGRITGNPADDRAVLAVAAQFWTVIHGFVLLELAGFYGTDPQALDDVLGALATNNLLALGDDPDSLRASRQAAQS